MSQAPPRVGTSVEDLCRSCKMVRKHTVIASGPDVLRVLCDHCGSQHNYRGGERAAAAPRAAPAAGGPASARVEQLSFVSEGEGSETTMGDDEGLERLLRRVIREEAGLTPVAPALRWRGGELVLRPGRPGLQEKSWPVETFFHKIVMLRNRMRTLEQQLNAAELPTDLKLKLQGYVTACYGSLTSFNLLFADEEDQFRGAGSSD